MRFIGIDPATVTGFVALDINGNVLLETEVKGEGKTEAGGITVEKLVSLENNLYKLLLPGDEIVLEDSAKGTQKGITTGMIHGGLRSMVHRKGMTFNLLNPQSTKKYVGVTGWVGEPGKKRLLKDKEKKAAVKAAVLEHFGYTHKSHNVIDAYIIARVSLNLYLRRELMQSLDTRSYQIEVVRDILEGKERE